MGDRFGRCMFHVSLVGDRSAPFLTEIGSVQRFLVEVGVSLVDS